LRRPFIVKFNLTTPGREDDEELEVEGGVAVLSGRERLSFMATTIYEGLGGNANVLSIDNCITRLRVEVKDMKLVNEAKIKEAQVPGVKIIGPTSIQVIVGPQVQFVADEIEKMRKVKNV
jgi:PTS system N-acetylglucosamine-specific IIC component